MPIYEHRCEHCDTQFEDFRKIADVHALPGCPNCGGPRCPQVVSQIKVGGVTFANTKEDEQAQRHFGVNRNARVHQSFVTGETLKFDRTESDKTVQEKIRQHYIKNGVKEAENPGSVKLRK